MKTHTLYEPGRPHGPSFGLSLWPRAAWCLALFFLFSVTGLRAQGTFIPVISQIIPAEDNATYFDQDGDLPAVIFITNNGTVTGAISGYYLTDTQAVPNKWLIPGGAVPLQIGPGQTMMVFASGKNRTQTPLATNFLLPCGSTGYLYNGQFSLVSKKAVAGENCPECIPLVSANTTSAWLVPTANNPPSTSGDWRSVNFSDSNWSRGLPCLGYETDPLAAGMVLYAAFDNGTVNTGTRSITDLSGPAVLHTGSWPNVAPQPVTIPTTPAQVQQSVGFTGPQNPNSYVFYNHHAELNPGSASYTFSIWVRPTNRDNTTGEVIFRKGGTNTTDPGYSLTRLPNQNGARFRIQTAATAYDAVFTTAGSLAADVWTHLTVVIERTSTLHQARLYRNGALAASVNFPAATSVGAATAQLVQAQGGGGLAMFQGFQDDFGIWSRALSNAEVTRVYEAGAAGKRIDDPSAPSGAGAIVRPCIQTDVQAVMKGYNTSIYERLSFNYSSTAPVNTMTLRIKYADGFIAYLNGVEIARRNAPTAAPAWNSAATADRTSTQAVVIEEIPVPAAGINALINGTNVLAIHGFTVNANDPFFLICPELCYDELGPEDCVVTTNGRLFWITFPGNAPEDSTTPLQLSVCITGAAGTTGNVSAPGLSPPFSQNYSLPAGGKIEIVIPKTATLDKSDLVENKGVKITASANVAVVGRSRIDYSTDTFLAHPVRCLGSSYITACWGNYWTGLPDLNGSQFGLVAIADNTHVTVKPKYTTGIHPAGTAYNFTLNAGQTYLLRNTSDFPADLTGSEITSDSPIAVFGGHRCANITSSLFFCDTVLEQTLPVSLWSTEYVIAPLATRTAQELVRVIASENSTQVSINGVLQSGTLNKGDKKDYSVGTAGAVITSAKKILVEHLSRSSDADSVTNADPFQLNAQPTASWLSGYRFCTPVAAEFSSSYVNVLARNAEIAGVTISPAPVAAGAIIAIGATGFSYRQVTLSPGTTYTTSGRTHGLEIYGWGQYDSYGHSGGMTFVDTQPPVLTQCPPDLTLFTSNIPGAGERATMPDLKVTLGIFDECCPDRTVVVSQSIPAGTLLAAGDYQCVVTATDCNNNTITCVIAIHVRTDPRQQAFPAQFGNPQTEATIWGWTADPDGDNITNEQEYLLGTSMTSCSSLHEALTFIDRGPNASSDVRLRVRADNPGLDYTLEGSFDLNGWFGGYGYFQQISSVPSSLPGYNYVTLRLTEWPGAQRLFGRLQVRRN